MKILVNKCCGGFGVTDALFKELGIEQDLWGTLRNSDFGIVSDNLDEYRSHPDLIRAVEKIGLDKSQDEYSKLMIVEIPDDVKWGIRNDVGYESIHEVHRVW